MEWALEPYEPRLTVWDTIKEKCSIEEKDEIKLLVGGSLIDEIEDLKNEVNMLLEIWRDCRDNSETDSSVHALPEPPLIRENLTKQIKLFMKLLREKQSNQKRDVIRKLSKDQSAIVKHVLNEDNVYQRPASARSVQDGRDTPMRATPVELLSRPSSALSDYSEILDEETIIQKLDDVADQLRHDILVDKAALESDVSFLQGCLMEEADYTSKSVREFNREPTLKELKDVGMVLEKEVLRKEASLEMLPSNVQSKEARDARITKDTNKNNGTEPLMDTKRSHKVRGAKHTTTTAGACPVKVVLLPSPPTTAKPTHSSASPGAAASRFRRLVLQYRNNSP